MGRPRGKQRPPSVTASVGGQPAAVESFAANTGVAPFADGYGDGYVGEIPDIPPALAVGEWAMWRHQRINPVTMAREVGGFPPTPDNLAKLIALHNDQLPDEDPRKRTRETVRILRAAAALADSRAPEVTDANKDDPHTLRRIEAYSELFAELNELADVVESMLPPEDATV